MSGAVGRQGFELLLAGDGKVGWRTSACAAPRGSQVRVKVEVVGICASDVALLTGTYAAPHRKPAVVPGHEWAGVVEAIGPDVQRLQIGDRVTGECSLWCGGCDRCGRNRNLCRKIEKFGITVDGAAREHLVIEERYLHRALPGIEADILALAEPLAVCHQGILAGLSAPISASSRVLVIGAGMIGLGSAFLLRRFFGCRRIHVHDLEPARLRRAEAFGVEALDQLPRGRASTAGYGELYGAEGFDLVIETTGAPAALERGIEILNPGGSLVLLGFTGSARLAPRLLVISGTRLVGSIGGSGSFEAIVPWLGEHAREARKLISHTLVANEAEDAFAIAQDRNAALKVQMRFAA